MGKKYKRRRYLIKKDEQGKFIFKFVIVSCLGSMITIALFNFLAQKKLDKVLCAMRLPPQTGEILRGEMLLANALAIIVIVLAFFIISRMILAGISGPLRKLGSDVGRIGEGNLDIPVKLRDKDEFQDFAHEVNLMREELRRRFVNITRVTNELSLMAEGTSLPRDYSDLRQRLGKKLDELEQELHTFKI